MTHRKVNITLPQTVTENFGMSPTLTSEQSAQLNAILQSVQLSAILDHISANYFDAADQCDGEDRDVFMQQASTVAAAALFCKTWR